jgi:serine protease Do
MLDPIRAKAKLIALAALTFTGGALFASALELTAGSYAAESLQDVPTRREVQPVAELSRAFVSIAESVTPAVVNISTERVVPMMRTRGARGDAPMQGTGTGFMIREDGYIMTNNHVVEGAEQIRVTMVDRRVFPATVVGRDPTTDVAIIKVEGTGFPTARLGASEEVHVGEWVLAIGNPLGLDFSVTTGIVSAKGRGLPILRQSLVGTQNEALTIEDFIQTDAAINPGNSGGPLVNLRGEVIGINTAIASETGFSEGYGFAVPMELAQRVAGDLIRYGRTRRPVMGVNIAQVLPEDAEVYRLPRVAGAVVQGFSEGSPARAAGLQQGDVIVAVDGRAVERTNELQRVIATRRAGERVTVDAIRYGDRKQFSFDLMEAPGVTVATASATRRGSGDLGIEVGDLSPELAARLGFNDTRGVLVTRVADYSAADRKSVTEQMKILEVDREPVRDSDHYTKLVAAKRPGEVISLLVEHRSGGQVIINVRIPR